MSARIVSLAALCLMLSAVVATAQPPAPPLHVDQGAIRQAVGSPQPQPLAQAPFVLNPQEESNLDRVLTDWQTMSAKVKTFEARFRRWDYDGVFGDGMTPKKIIDGAIKYAAPDKGFYDLDDHSEKWICTGDAVFEFRTDLKQVREHRLPANMRGKAISDGPMPFVFGVEAQKMKNRYWLRLTTPPQVQGTQVWIEAFPKEAKDAANFYKMDVILTIEVKDGALVKLEPFAINMVMPNQKDRTAYQFTEMTVNGILNNFEQFLGIFVRPATPFNWQHQIMDDGAAAGPESAQAPQPTVPR